jgi:uncharacterized protein (TIGR00251 family)
VILAVRVIPRSPKSAISGMRGDAVLVRLAAPPVDGAANEALLDFLAQVFERPRRDVTIIGGLKSRDKRVNIEGPSEAALAARLAAVLEAGR